MTPSTFGQIAGGIGLFLLGMGLMTDSLKARGGRALRRLLDRVTQNRMRAFGIGAAVTALIQSSSATTLATVGFVSAGLLTFPASLGIIFGANVGTTATAWIVSLVGFKLDMSLFALPMIAVGSLMRLLSRGRKAEVGLILAGFGLVFVGIDVLQEGMQGLGPSLSLESWAVPGLWGRLLLVGVGIAMTVIMQSSSAAMATTLTALHVGTLGFEHAAALVIGQNVGTTVTAGLSAAGGTVAARRAAVAHALFNIATGALALGLLDPFTEFVVHLGPLAPSASPALSLALFHTSFNVLGAALFLPLADPFARLVKHLVPARAERFTRRLSPSVLLVPTVATEAARMTAVEIADDAFEVAASVLQSAAWAVLDEPGFKRIDAPRRLARLSSALEQTRRFIGRAGSSVSTRELRSDLLDLLHGVEHLQRLVDACDERIHEPFVRDQEALRTLAEDLGECFSSLPSMLTDATPRSVLVDDEMSPMDEGLSLEGPRLEVVAFAEGIAQRMANSRRERRAAFLEDTARGRIEPDEVESLLKASRWMDRLAYHTWRALVHLLGDSESALDPSGTDGMPEIPDRGSFEPALVAEDVDAENLEGHHSP